ncbi:MAG TPA: DinB family protein [Thermoanaerobaculia bacterium]|nr:DinB family protein [Thermoanaerobaculia bacterium]
MKNAREFFVDSFRSEKPRFVKVLQAVPAGQTAYRPHERCSTAGDIAWLIASEWDDALSLIDKGSVEFVPKPAPAHVRDSVAAFEKNAAEVEKRIERLDDAAWDRPAKFLMDGKVMWEAPLGDMLYGFLFDAVHHRGQLSSYLRPMGARVPSIYGPSADDSGA